MNPPPRISIVTPSYNQGEFIEATIDSILSQGYPNLEYIIIDGGSTDQSVEIIKKYAHHLAFWSSEKDHGQYDAINKGFSRATGEIMAWLNSDDMYFPWTFRVVSSIMAEFSQVEWITTLQQGWWDWYGMPLGFAGVAGFSRQAFLDGCYLPGKSLRPLGWIQQESTFWRRSLWNTIGASISTEFNAAGDFDLWSRFYARTDLYGVQSPLAGFRFQAAQKTTHTENYISEAEKALNRFRTQSGWTPAGGATSMLQKTAARIPLLRRSARAAYTGKRISRVNVNGPEAAWQISEAPF